MDWKQELLKGDPPPPGIIKRLLGWAVLSFCVGLLAVGVGGALLYGDACQVGMALLLAGGLTGLGYYGYQSQQQEQARVAALARRCPEAGFTFTAQPTEWPADFPQVCLDQVPLFQQGHTRRLRNLAVGMVEEQGVFVFDWSCEQGSGSDTTTTTQTVALIRSQRGRIPEFRLTPRTLDHRVAEWFGFFKDIDFGPETRFSERYLLRGPDEERIRRVFTPAVRELFDRARKHFVECAGGCLAFYRWNERYPAEQWLELVRLAAAVATALERADRGCQD